MKSKEIEEPQAGGPVDDQAARESLVDQFDAFESIDPELVSPVDVGFVWRACRTSDGDVTLTEKICFSFPSDADLADATDNQVEADQACAADGEPVIVMGRLQLHKVVRAPRDKASGDMHPDATVGGAASLDEWRAQWRQLDPDYDDAGVVRQHWHRSELPAYVVPGPTGVEPVRPGLRLERPTAAMPGLTFALPMDEQGRRYGNNDLKIQSWGVPRPTSPKLSDAERDSRKITVRVQYRVTGWSFGWPPAA